MATQAEVNAWIAANPNATHAEILAAATAAGVSIEQIAAGYNIPVQDVRVAVRQMGGSLPSTTASQVPTITPTAQPVTQTTTQTAAQPTKTTEELINEAVFLNNAINTLKFGAGDPGRRQESQAQTLINKYGDMAGAETALANMMQSNPRVAAHINAGSRGDPFSAAADFANDAGFTTYLPLAAGAAYGLGALSGTGGATTGAASAAGGATGGTGMGAFTAEQLAGSVLSGTGGSGIGLTAGTLGTAGATAGTSTLVNAATTGKSILDTIKTAITDDPFKVLSGVTGIISGVTGLVGGEGDDAALAADPFGPYRATMAQHLSDFIANPLGNAGFASTVTPTAVSQIQASQAQASAAVQAQQATAQRAAYNPTAFTGGLQTGDYIGQLNNLMANPSNITNLPGYDFLQRSGQQAVQRALAAQGRTASGQELIALQEQNQGLANQQFLQQQQFLGQMAQAQSGEAQNIWGTTNQIGASQANLNAQLGTQTAQFNTGQANQVAVQNAVQAQQAGQFNATLAQQAATTNAANQQQADQYNQSLLANQYNNQLSNLGNLAGAGFNPATAATLGQNVNSGNWSDLGAGVATIGNAFS